MRGLFVAVLQFKKWGVRTGLFVCNLRPKHPASSCR